MIKVPSQKQARIYMELRQIGVSPKLAKNWVIKKSKTKDWSKL